MFCFDKFRPVCILVLLINDNILILILQIYW